MSALTSSVSVILCLSAGQNNTFFIKVFIQPCFQPLDSVFLSK